MMSRLSCWLTAIATLVLAAPPAAATVLVPADLGELAHDARAIVRGRIVAVDSRWSDDHRSIETIVTVEAERYLKGAWGPTVQFRVPGGELGRFRSIFVGAPEFAVDERIVVFLGTRGPTLPYLIGLGQGVYRVSRTADRAWVVTPAPLYPNASATTRVVRGDTARRPVALADFEERVRSLAGGVQ
jgi:hypothetical protein